jgi:Peptidase C13 family
MNRLVRDCRITFRRVWRLCVCRRATRSLSGPGSLAILAIFAAWLGLAALNDSLEARADFGFSEYGLISAISIWAIFSAAIAIFSVHEKAIPLKRALADGLALSVLSMIPVLAISAALSLFPAWKVTVSPAISVPVYAAFFCIAAWLGFSFWRMGQVLWAHPVKYAGAKVLGALIIGTFLVPSQPIVYGTYTVWQPRDVWYWSRTAANYFAETKTAEAQDQVPEPDIDVETTLYRQPGLIKQAVDNMLPSSADRAQLFFVGVAPSSAQSVFASEVLGAQALFDQRFGTEGRSLSLVNSRETIDNLPLASSVNLAAALEGVGQVMRGDKDVLVLFITSHGAKNLISVSFPYFDFKQITPKSLSQALDKAKIKNRVIIISACHSGSFIPALKNENTIVMAAASPEKTSFGCSNERDWTYFGDALINHALRKTKSFTAAFEQAREQISDWEKEQQLIPSEPQMFAGAEIVKLLDNPRPGALDGTVPLASE